MHNTFVLGESVPVLLQSCYEYIVLVYYPYKLSITVKMEDSAPCTYHNAFGPSMNRLATQITCFPLFHGIIGADS